VKEALAYLGKIKPVFRPPLTNLSKDKKEKLIGILEEFFKAEKNQ